MHPRTKSLIESALLKLNLPVNSDDLKIPEFIHEKVVRASDKLNEMPLYPSIEDERLIEAKELIQDLFTAVKTQTVDGGVRSFFVFHSLEDMLLTYSYIKPGLSRLQQDTLQDEKRMALRQNIDPKPFQKIISNTRGQILWRAMYEAVEDLCVTYLNWKTNRYNYTACYF